MTLVMIQTKNLAFSYNGKANFNFPDISLNSGEVLLITGGSGKGKTTLLHLLGGLLKAQSGSIRIGDVNIETLSNKNLDKFRGKNIGLILQQSHFVEAFSVFENVVLFFLAGNRTKGRRKSKITFGRTGTV